MDFNTRDWRVKDDTTTGVVGHLGYSVWTNLPMIVYAPVKLAHWKRNSDFCMGEPEAHCSNCGYDVVYVIIDNRYEFAPYCPQCGSKMSEETE